MQNGVDFQEILLYFGALNDIMAISIYVDVQNIVSTFCREKQSVSMTALLHGNRHHKQIRC